MKKTTKDLEKEFGINRKTLFFYEDKVVPVIGTAP